jgi:molybdopterin-guanine dinucleotide biosynthesis protein A
MTAADHAHVFSIVLAGGEGKRLAPLTLDRAKPAVPFGGNYRLIDFALSNLVNAGYRRIVVLTQYKSRERDRPRRRRSRRELIPNVAGAGSALQLARTWLWLRRRRGPGHDRHHDAEHAASSASAWRPRAMCSRR